MMPLYDQNLNILVQSFIIRAIANDKDLKLKPRKVGLIKRLIYKIKYNID